MDLTPGPEIYRACAEASWDAPGTQRIWRSYQRETYVELMLARPDFCALVDVAYRAGREDAANDSCGCLGYFPRALRPSERAQDEVARGHQSREDVTE